MKPKIIPAKIPVSLVLITFLSVLFLPLRVLALTTEDSRAIYGDHAIYQDVCGDIAASVKSLGGKVYLIGDSVAEGAKAALDGTIPGITMNTKVSRSLTEGGSELNGLTVLSNDKASYADADTVIIELGTNSSGLNETNIKKAIETVKQNNTGAKIYWVNIGNTSRNVDDLNAIIKSNESAGYTVIDWASQVKQNPGHVGDLGVHLTPTGIPAYTGAISAALNGETPSATSGASSSVSEEGCVCSAEGGGGLVGADNPEKVWNFFIEKGLTPPQVAGIMGNMKRESGFNPLRVQGTKTPDEDSPDPNVAGSRGWGLIQWTPGSKAILAASQAGITTPIHELATQLELVWGHLNNKPPITTGKFDVNFFKTITDVGQAVSYFETHIEGAGVKALEQRNQFAQEFLGLFGSGTSGMTGGGGSGSGCPNGGAFNYGKYASMTRDQLVNLILNAPNWKPQSQNPVKDINSGVAVDNLLRLIAALLESVPTETLTPSVIQTGHSCRASSGNISNHMGGLAIDLGGAGHTPESMNTVFSWLYTNRVALGINELIFEPVPLGTSTLKHGEPLEYNAGTREQHRNHIHVSVQGPIPTSCP